MYNIEYENVQCKVCRDVKCRVCKYAMSSIQWCTTYRCCCPWWYRAPSWDGDTLVDHTSCPAQWSATRSSILKRYFGILTGRPDTVVFWYFGHVFWYFVASARHENGLFLRHRLLVSAVAPPASDCMTGEVAFRKLIPYLFKAILQLRPGNKI